MQKIKTMEKLEIICQKKFKIMRNIVYTEQEYKCYNCTGYQDKSCYKPMIINNMPVNKGVFAYMRR